MKLCKNDYLSWWLFSQSFMRIGQKMCIFCHWPIFERVWFFLPQTLCAEDVLVILEQKTCCDIDTNTVCPVNDKWFLHIFLQWQLKFFYEKPIFLERLFQSILVLANSGYVLVKTKSTIMKSQMYGIAFAFLRS